MTTVSIPVGFFQALQRREIRGGRLGGQGFNPCRVFSGLATRRLVDLPRPHPGFNPCRVFSGLATRCSPTFPTPNPLFQSLSGFFRPCNSFIWSLVLTHPVGFNPCRVFSGLATSEEEQVVYGVVLGFNPCRVFSGLATIERGPGDVTILPVSIPVGFFQALQQPAAP